MIGSVEKRLGRRIEERRKKGEGILKDDHGKSKKNMERGISRGGGYMLH